MLALRGTRNIWGRVLSKCNANSCTRNMSLAAQQEIQPPILEGETKTFPPKIVKMVDEISNLSLLEVSELNELLRIKLNISDLPMMAAGMAPAAANVDAEDEAPVLKVQTEFKVKLTSFNTESKVKLIKAIKTLMPDMNLVKAKQFVESVPQVVRQDVPKEEADEVLKTLTEAGGTAIVE